MNVCLFHIEAFYWKTFACCKFYKLFCGRTFFKHCLLFWRWRTVGKFYFEAGMYFILKFLMQVKSKFYFEGMSFVLEVEDSVGVLFWRCIFCCLFFKMIVLFWRWVHSGILFWRWRTVWNFPSLVMTSNWTFSFSTRTKTSFGTEERRPRAEKNSSNVILVNISFLW